jgi:hypothetical protein
MLLLVAGTGSASVGGPGGTSGTAPPSFVHALHYVVIMLRMPDFLGHVTVQLLADSDGYVQANMPEYVTCGGAGRCGKWWAPACPFVCHASSGCVRLCACVCVCVRAGLWGAAQVGGHENNGTLPWLCPPPLPCCRWIEWARFAFRIAYIVVMQIFFKLMSQVG